MGLGNLNLAIIIKKHYNGFFDSYKRRERRKIARERFFLFKFNFKLF